jgi:hypothetical protein
MMYFSERDLLWDSSLLDSLWYFISANDPSMTVQVKLKGKLVNNAIINYSAW